MKARYICTRSHAKKMVVLLWIASFVLALPIIKGQVLAFDCYNFTQSIRSLNITRSFPNRVSLFHWIFDASLVGKKGNSFRLLN